MKKLALIFAVAVLIPSLVLAWLAIRSLKDQQFLLERQQSLLYQGTADTAARQAADLIESCNDEFAAVLEQLLRGQDPASLVATFDETIRGHWPLAQLGFVVSLDGRVLCPKPNGRAEARDFLGDYSRFLGNRETLEVYSNVKQLPAQVLANDQKQQESSSWSKDSSANRLNAVLRNTQQRSVVPQQNYSKLEQQVAVPAPQPAVDNSSRVSPSETEFRQLIGEQSRGSLARYVDNKLNLLVWQRPAKDPGTVFGAMLSLPRLVEKLEPVTRTMDRSLAAEACVVLLDDSARPAAKSHPSFQTNWKRPFVATEIGEALPHWEIGIYLLDPARLPRSAGLFKLTLGLLIALLVATIGTGSWLIVTDLNRQLALARKKTDFVSNVSHELKTPLTSIRMFSELLAEGRVTDAGKQREYLGIITAETARLTRLINNVLDLAKMDRGEKNYRLQTCLLNEVVCETVDLLRPHLSSAGFQLKVAVPEELIPVRADRDALAQIVVNLLSNAEKYAGEQKEISIELSRKSGAPGRAEVRVLDRGLGVPRGCEEKIFEQFYRAHDSLNSGIPGTGLGLTLARQIARAHGGDVCQERREGGGSVFTLWLPTTANDP